MGCYSESSRAWPQAAPQESLPIAFCKTDARKGSTHTPTCSPKQCCKSDKKGGVKEPARVSLKQSHPPRETVPSYLIKPGFAHVLPLVSTQLLHHPGLPGTAGVRLAFGNPCASPATQHGLQLSEEQLFVTLLLLIPPPAPPYSIRYLCADHGEVSNFASCTWATVQAMDLALAVSVRFYPWLVH